METLGREFQVQADRVAFGGREAAARPIGKTTTRTIPSATWACRKDAYKEANLLTYAADVKRPLMLEHGTADDNVYFRHTLKLVDALFRAGKDYNLLPLSGTHMVYDPVVTERRWERITRFFQTHLGAPK